MRMSSGAAWLVQLHGTVLRAARAVCGRMMNLPCVGAAMGGAAAAGEEYCAETVAVAGMVGPSKEVMSRGCLKRWRRG
jgi:hypothetical protein